MRKRKFTRRLAGIEEWNGNFAGVENFSFS